MQEIVFQREKVAKYQDMRVYLVTLPEILGENAYLAVLNRLGIRCRHLPTMTEIETMLYIPQGVFVHVRGPRIASSR